MNELQIKNTFDWFKNNWVLINKPSLDECNEILIKIINEYNSIINTIITDYSKSFKNNGKINDKKTFANNIKENKFKKILFNIYDHIYDNDDELNSLYTANWIFNGLDMNSFIFTTMENSEFFKELFRNH